MYVDVSNWTPLANYQHFVIILIEIVSTINGKKLFGGNFITAIFKMEKKEPGKICDTLAADSKSQFNKLFYI
jgi:hypothetical protein